MMETSNIQLITLVALALGFSILEALAPWRKKAPLKERASHTAYDIVSMLVAFMAGGAGAALAAKLFPGATIPRPWPSFFEVGSINLLRVVVAVVLIDLATYLVHRALHEIPVLNRFHNWHHTIESLNWLSGFRASVTHSLVFTFIPQFVVPFMILHCTPFEAAIAFSVQVLAHFWAHANVNCEKPSLLWVFITPAFHRVHHANVKSVYNSNYAGIFVVFDKLFGTYVDPQVIKRDVKFGLDERTSKIPLRESIRYLIGV